MPTRLTDATYWRERAQEAHAQAGKTENTQARRILFEIAASYEKLAALAKTGRKSEFPPHTD